MATRFIRLNVCSSFENLFYLFKSDYETELETIQFLIDTEFSKSFTQIEPVFNKDGFYFDRKKSFVWYEWRGTAWTNNKLKDRFKFEFDAANHVPMSNETFNAIKIVLRYNRNKELLDLYVKEDFRRMLKNVTRNSYISRIEMLNEN
jgi:hypothetical protein